MLFFLGKENGEEEDGEESGRKEGSGDEMRLQRRKRKRGSCETNINASVFLDAAVLIKCPWPCRGELLVWKFRDGGWGISGACAWCRMGRCEGSAVFCLSDFRTERDEIEDLAGRVVNGFVRLLREIWGGGLGL